MSNYILGLNIGNHDSAVALIKDGEIVSFIEQERISRNKMAFGEPPIEAVQACLKYEKICLHDVYAVAVGMDWKFRNRIYQMPEDERVKYSNFENIDWYLPKKIFGNEIPPVYVVRHHLAHASSAFRVSGFDECAVLVVDNRGEDASTSLGYAKNGEITFFKQINIQNSLGIFYNRAARYTGLYGKFREVGKFMGLASYGVPNVKMPLSPSKDLLLFKELPNIEDESIFDSINLRTMHLNDFFKNNCFPYESGNTEEIMSYANFAASVQNSLENVLIEFCKELKDKTKMDNLVIAGGVALNCSANGKIEQSNLFDNIFIPPFASDSGTAVGAGLEIYNKLFGNSFLQKRLNSAALGISYDDDLVLNSLMKQKNKVNWDKINESKLCVYVASQISNGKIVGWVQDGFEAGPRALGNRSILADPRNRKSLIRLNKLKKREMWRPIAPSVLEEFYSEYFTGKENSKYFMNVAAVVKENKRNVIPAVVHVDYTARPQVVMKEQKKYYNLIKSFYDITGVPILCNTSFNDKGMPLVTTPENAIECFLNIGIDLLVIGNFIVIKR